MIELIHPIISSITAICPGAQSSVCATGIPQVSANTHTAQHVFQLLFGILAAIAVLIIVINALRLVISQGNPDTVKKAREAIVASVIGLIISVSAEIIVSFVIGKL